MAFTMNIGLGGLCLLTNKAYQVGARLELTIQLGNDESLHNDENLQVGAVVAWTRPGKAIGVRFDSLDEKQNARLVELLGSAQQNLRKTIR
jgi:Tfp pilus assembly protein PilZ